MNLIIGAEKSREGWVNLNLDEKHNPDIVGDARDMPLDDESVDRVYMSHVLEHFGYRSGGVEKVLSEVYRVLVPGGLFQVSVPDMSTLCEMYLASEGYERLKIMRCIMGGQTNDLDIHMIAFDGPLLISYLHYAGFKDMRKVNTFGLFEDDCSVIKIKDTYISLNVEATKPEKE